jgi:hypothetical protein
MTTVKAIAHPNELTKEEKNNRYLLPDTPTHGMTMTSSGVRKREERPNRTKYNL